MLRKLTLAAAAFVLTAAPAFAASHLYISEYTNLGVATGQIAQVASEPSTDQSVVDYTAGVAASAAFQTSTNYVRVLCTSTCSIKFVKSGNATTANKPQAAGVPEYYAVPPNQNYSISVISNPDF